MHDPSSHLSGWAWSLLVFLTFCLSLGVVADSQQEKQQLQQASHHRHRTLPLSLSVRTLVLWNTVYKYPTAKELLRCGAAAHAQTVDNNYIFGGMTGSWSTVRVSWQLQALFGGNEYSSGYNIILVLQCRLPVVWSHSVWLLQTLFDLALYASYKGLL